jgi:hypothetical protein
MPFPVGAGGALAAEQDTNWRTGYLVHFRRLVEAGLASKDAAVSVARGGLRGVSRYVDQARWELNVILARE